jgi:hypothetical protein
VYKSQFHRRFATGWGSSQAEWSKPFYFIGFSGFWAAFQASGGWWLPEIQQQKSGFALN